MRLIKRRSAPVIPQYQPPSTSTTSLNDRDFSRDASGTRPFEVPPPLPKSSSSFDVRLPGTTLSGPSFGGGGIGGGRKFSAFSHVPGTEVPEADNLRGNDPSSLGDEGRRRPSTSKHQEDIDGDGAAGKKRDSTGQNRYPPNSLVPGTGWGFGRMRRSRKQDVKALPPLPLRRCSLS